MDGALMGDPSCSSTEEGRGCRSKRRISEPICCPVCSLTLRPTEVQTHFMQEIDKLAKIANKYKSNGRSNEPSSSTTEHPDKTWETFQKVRSNRQNRHRSKNKKRRSEVPCPICNKETSEEITMHVERCLRQNGPRGSGSESEENIDVEAFEEYEWAGQSRVRITSLLPGGVANLGTSISMTEEDEDLNVDGDDGQTFGSPQYSEGDIMLLPGDLENIALRKAVSGEVPKHVQPANNETTLRAGDPVVEVLKHRIRELETRDKNPEEIHKCLICMERYKTPVISVCCWHVHCEECWLQTLGAKKLCPQCNMITSPTDLRRIYM